MCLHITIFLPNAALSCDFPTAHGHTHFPVISSIQALTPILICIIASLSISLPLVSRAATVCLILARRVTS